MSKDEFERGEALARDYAKNRNAEEGYNAEHIKRVMQLSRSLQECPDDTAEAQNIVDGMLENAQKLRSQIVNDYHLDSTVFTGAEIFRWNDIDELESAAKSANLPDEIIEKVNELRSVEKLRSQNINWGVYDDKVENLHSVNEKHNGIAYRGQVTRDDIMRISHLTIDNE